MGFMAAAAEARCGVHHQDDSERVHHRRVRHLKVSREAIAAAKRVVLSGAAEARHGLELGASLCRLTSELRRTQRHGPARRKIDKGASRGHAVACRLERQVRRRSPGIGGLAS